MAKRRDQFGEAVFEIAVTEDSKLKSRMQSSERIIRDSTGRMSKDFQRMSTSAEAVQQPIADTGLVFSGFAAQASLLGGRMGRVASQAAILGLGMRSLGRAMFGLPGIVLGVTAALGFFINRIIAAKQRTKALNDELKQMGTSAFAALGTRLKTIRSVEDILTARRARGDPILGLQAAGRNEDIRLQREQRTNAERSVQLQREAFAIERRIGELRKEDRIDFDEVRRLSLAKSFLDRETGALKVQLEQFADLRLLNETQTRDAIQAIREANRKTELQKEAEQARKIADARQKAFQQQLERARATPLGKVLGAAFDIIRERREKAAITGILDRIGRILPFGFGKDMIEEVRQRLGVGLGAVSVARPGVTGSIPLSAFAQTGAGRPGGGPSATDDALRKHQERERTIAAKATAAAVESIDRKTGRGSG